MEGRGERVGSPRHVNTTHILIGSLWAKASLFVHGAKDVSTWLTGVSAWLTGTLQSRISQPAPGEGICGRLEKWGPQALLSREACDSQNFCFKPRSGMSAKCRDSFFIVKIFVGSLIHCCESGGWYWLDR